MIFVPLIYAWGDGDRAASAQNLAADLGLPVKNVYRWLDEDSIPAGWFVQVIAAAKRRGIKGVTAVELAQLAARRRECKPESRARPKPTRAA